MTELKDRMKMQLARVGLTQIEAARKANVKRDYIHKAVQRNSVPNNKDIRNKISNTLMCNDSWLWSGFVANLDSNSKKPIEMILGPDQKTQISIKKIDGEMHTVITIL